MSKKICGVGVNDADYTTQVCDSVTVNGKQRNKVIWRCPFYCRWTSMISRCYGKQVKEYYNNCTVCDEWLLFSNFRKWMIEQDWENKSLDKDILVKGNREYHPDKCCFVHRDINALFTSAGKVRGEYPIGVTFDKATDRFIAKIAMYGKSRSLGRFNNVTDAYLCYKYWKEAYIKQVSYKHKQFMDTKVYDALLNWVVEVTD